MLQRIQTVFILLAIVFIVLSLALPIAFYSNLTVSSQFDYTILKFLSTKNTNTLGFNSLPLFVPAILSALLSLVQIVMYKKRKVQINLGVYSMVLNVLYLGLLVYYMTSVLNHSVSGDVQVSHKYPLIFPVISLVFSYLAIRNIRKDDDLVKSLDRLR